jgi:hypothetical protein
MRGEAKRLSHDNEMRNKASNRRLRLLLHSHRINSSYSFLSGIRVNYSLLLVGGSPVTFQR